MTGGGRRLSGGGRREASSVVGGGGCVWEQGCGVERSGGEEGGRKRGGESGVATGEEWLLVSYS